MDYSEVTPSTITGLQLEDMKSTSRRHRCVMWQRGERWQADEEEARRSFISLDTSPTFEALFTQNLSTWLRRGGSWREDVCLCINTCGEDFENFTSFYKLVSLSPHMLYTCNNSMESWMGIVYLKKIKSLVVQNSPSYFENLQRISRSNWWLSKKSEPPPKTTTTGQVRSHHNCIY